MDNDLKRIIENIMNNCKSKGEPIKYVCEKCKDSGLIVYSDEKGRTITKRCQCYYKKQAEMRMLRSGISKEFQSKSFENFIADNDQRISAKNKAIHFCEVFEEHEHNRRNSLLLCGQVGSGKTHLGVAVCKYLINKGVSTTYMAYRNAITRIKQTITDEILYEEAIRKYATARLLYIDDFLKGKLTDSDVNILYEIINHRYMNNLPLVISTEKNLSELIAFDEAIASRIIEMSRGNIVFFEGKDLNYRLYSDGGE